MDSGRQHDLQTLHGVLNNPNETERHKRQARNSIKKIELVARDPKIRSLRERLIKAHRANDQDAAEKIGSEIRSYQGSKYGFV